MKSDPSCRLCVFLHVDTASDHEWLCPIYNDIICETHCYEVQLADYDDTRSCLVDMLGNELGKVRILETCEVCPHGGLPS